MFPKLRYIKQILTHEMQGNHIRRFQILNIDHLHSTWLFYFHKFENLYNSLFYFRRLVEALGIQSIDGGHFECTIYSDSLKQEARYEFCTKPRN